MKTFFLKALLLPVFVFGFVFLAAAPRRALAVDEVARLGELDRFWNAVSQSVQSGDFAAYQATCHPEGVLVSGGAKTSQPLTKALERWKPGFDDTKAGRTKAKVVFRMAQRLGDETTAHETGIFLYTLTDAQGETKTDYVHFEVLLVKRGGGWQVLMEYQKSAATAAEWAALRPMAEGKAADAPKKLQP